MYFINSVRFSHNCRWSNGIQRAATVRYTKHQRLEHAKLYGTVSLVKLYGTVYGRSSLYGTVYAMRNNPRFGPKESKN